MAEQQLTAARLRKVLHYDLLTGVFTWRIRPANRMQVGDIAGGQDGDGYVRIRVDGRRYRAHRLAWLYMTGKWPSHEIDHENTVRSDNWWTNLRDATHAQNAQNLRRAHKNSASGLLGVSAERDRWKASIRTGGKLTHLGVFLSAEDAHAAYLVAKANVHPFQTITERQ